MKLADCVVLVTGGSSGLGAAVSLMAWEAGARVLIADRAAPRDDNPLRLRDPQGERWLWQATDVSDEAQASAAVNQALTRFGRLDVLVNAAGVAAVEKLHGRDGPHQLASFQKVIQVNLLGSFNMMRLAAAAMLASPARPGSNEVDSRGVIVNTASIAAFDGQMGQVAYAASKGGVVAMTLPAARDLARDRIRVMTVAPGVFHTPMMATLPAFTSASSTTPRTPPRPTAPSPPPSAPSPMRQPSPFSSTTCPDGRSRTSMSPQPNASPMIKKMSSGPKRHPGT